MDTESLGCLRVCPCPQLCLSISCLRLLCSVDHVSPVHLWTYLSISVSMCYLSVSPHLPTCPSTCFHTLEGDVSCSLCPLHAIKAARPRQPCVCSD